MIRLVRQRLDRPYVRVHGKLKPATWAEAFAAIAARVKATTPERMAAIVGDLAAAEEIKALKDLMTALKVKNLDCRQDGAKLPAESEIAARYGVNRHTVRRAMAELGAR